MAERLSNDLLKPLADLRSWLDAVHAQAVIIGGVAVSFLQDIETLLDAHPDVDLGPVRQWVSDFAAATSMSDLLADFDKIIARRKQQ